MSLRVRITWFCNKCGVVLKEDENSSISADRVNRMRSDFQSDLRKSGGMITTRRGPTVHYCHSCADGVPTNKQVEGSNTGGEGSNQSEARLSPKSLTSPNESGELSKVGRRRAE